MTYDIDTTEPEGRRRLAHVARLCESYGIRVQFSVFECRVTETMLAAMTAALVDLIDRQRDSVRIYRMVSPLDRQLTTLGRPAARSLGQPWIV